MNLRIIDLFKNIQPVINILLWLGLIICLIQLIFILHKLWIFKNESQKMIDNLNYTQSLILTLKERGLVIYERVNNWLNIIKTLKKVLNLYIVNQFLDAIIQRKKEKR